MLSRGIPYRRLGQIHRPASNVHLGRPTTRPWRNASVTTPSTWSALSLSPAVASKTEQVQHRSFQRPPRPSGPHRHATLIRQSGWRVWHPFPWSTVSQHVVCPDVVPINSVLELRGVALRRRGGMLTPCFGISWRGRVLLGYREGMSSVRPRAVRRVSWSSR